MTNSVLRQSFPLFKLQVSVAFIHFPPCQQHKVEVNGGNSLVTVGKSVKFLVGWIKLGCLSVCFCLHGYIVLVFNKRGVAEENVVQHLIHKVTCKYTIYGISHIYWYVAIRICLNRCKEKNPFNFNIFYYRFSRQLNVVIIIS